MSQHKGADKVLFTIVFLIFFIHCFTLLLPLLWMFISSFKDPNEYFLQNPFSLPQKWLISNYIDAFTSLNTGSINFATMVLNSLWYTALSTFSSLVGPSVVGYVLARYDFKGKNFLYAVIIFSITIPIVGSTASAMRLNSALGLYDNPLKLVVNICAGFSSSFLVYYGYFKSISGAYSEAAEIDGANAFIIFFRIMIPQAAPIYLTFAITNGIGVWNDYESVILWFPSYLTIAAGLFQYKSNAARANYPVYYSGLIISLIPALVLFAIFSDKIMTSISVGGLKG